jgi:CRP-like cAMP-binding protein
MYHIASKETYKDGQIIFKEGSSGNWIYVVLSGSVEISKTIGGKKSMLSVLEPDEVFGELGYLGYIKRTATVRAVGETTVGVIDRTFLDKEFNRLSGYFRTILVAVVKRFGNMIDRTCKFSSRKEARAQKMYIPQNRDEQSRVKRLLIPRESGYRNHEKRPNKKTERRSDLDSYLNL